MFGKRKKGLRELYHNQMKINASLMRQDLESRKALLIVVTNLLLAIDRMDEAAALLVHNEGVPLSTIDLLDTTDLNCSLITGELAT